MSHELSRELRVGAIRLQGITHQVFGVLQKAASEHPLKVVGGFPCDLFEGATPMLAEVEEDAVAIANEFPVEVGRSRIAISDAELTDLPRQVRIVFQHGIEDVTGSLDIGRRTMGPGMFASAVESDGCRKVSTFPVVEDLQRVDQGPAIEE